MILGKGRKRKSVLGACLVLPHTKKRFYYVNLRESRNAQLRRLRAHPGWSSSMILPSNGPRVQDKNQDALLNGQSSDSARRLMIVTILHISDDAPLWPWHSRSKEIFQNLHFQTPSSAQFVLTNCDFLRFGVFDRFPNRRSLKATIQT